MGKVSEAMIDIDIHRRFARWCSCENNQKASFAADMVRGETGAAWTRYFDLLGRSKSLAQRRAKALVLGVPQEAVLAGRSISDMGRILFVRFATVSGPGDAVSADLKSRGHFTGTRCERWMQ